MTVSQREYVPGVCNLGTAETRVRLIFGSIGLLLTIGTAVGVLIGDVPQGIRLIVFVPAMTGTLGFLQAFWHFCAAYGMLGVFNVSTSLGRSDTVEQAEFRRQDRRTALTIIGLSLLIAVAMTACVYVMPT